MVAIPAGFFFNWRFGLRRIVPPAVTELRWRNLLNRCAREGGVVHLWLHPHNLITGPGTAPVLSSVPVPRAPADPSSVAHRFSVA